VDCRKPLDRQGIRCQACNAALAEWARERREARRKQGLCPDCGGPLEPDGFRQCWFCRTVSAGRKRANYAKRHGKPIMVQSGLTEVADG